MTAMPFGSWQESVRHFNVYQSYMVIMLMIVFLNSPIQTSSVGNELLWREATVKSTKSPLAKAVEVMETLRATSAYERLLEID